MGMFIFWFTIALSIGAIVVCVGSLLIPFAIQKYKVRKFYQNLFNPKTVV